MAPFPVDPRIAEVRRAGRGTSLFVRRTREGTHIWGDGNAYALESRMNREIYESAIRG